MVTLALQAFSLGLWSISCQSILSKAFIAKKDPLTPALVALFSLFCGLHVSILLMGEIQASSASMLTTTLISYQQFLFTPTLGQNFGHVGLALGSTATSLISCLLFFILFKIREPSADLTPFIRSSYLSIIASSILAALLIQIQ
jgi:peptidoglycan biosynthesis protein MviN/MurJ (putative lipid II flippase)